MKTKATSILLLLIISCAPSPSIQYRIYESDYPPKADNYDIIVYGDNVQPPANTVVIGEVSIGNTRDYGFNTVIEYARKIGGDAIKIKNWYSSSLKADILVFKGDLPKLYTSLPKTEEEFRKYYDENFGNLDEIEGIWSYQQSISIAGVDLGPSIDYRFAIIKDTTESLFDYIAVILESKKTQWTPGKIKAKFRKTAYENVFEAIWYMADFSENRYNFIIDETGILKHLDEKMIGSYALKQYPTFSKSLKTQDESSSNIKTTGSGFLFNKSGIIITNYHIIKEAQKIEIFFPSSRITKQAIIKLLDKINDIAILELTEFNFNDLSSINIPYTIGNINSVRVGQEVFTLGFPLGSIMGTEPRFSSGRINSLYGIEEDPRLFQISNPLQPGNSGGPLFNENGELVGIVVSGLNAEYFYENLGIIPQNVNFAVKISYIESLIEMLPSEEKISQKINLLDGKKIEEQIELLTPFIVQVRSY